jgi:PAS domain S-box-containing protein
MRFCESSPVQIPVGLFRLIMPPQGVSRLVWANVAFLEIVDDPCVQVPMQFGDLVHPHDRAGFDDILRGAAHSGAATFWQGRLQSGTGCKSVRVDLTPPDTDDPAQPWTGVLQDLSDVMDLQSRFESVLDAAQAYTWRRDMRSGQSQFGMRWAQFAKHEDGRTSMSSDDWLARLHPDDVPAVRAAVQALERGDLDHHTLLYRRQLEDGSWVWLRVHAGVSERDGAGIPTALSGVSFDVTAEIEQRQRSDLLNQELCDELFDAQAALERTAYEITENIPVGTYTIVLMSGEDLPQFRFMSRKFLEITGLEEDQARADPLIAFACVHPDDYDAWVQKNTHAFIHKMPFREETRLLVKGELRWVIAESIPRLRDDGAWIWEGVIQDITSQKASEQAVRRANKKLLKFANAKARLAERERLLQDIHDGFGNQLAIGKIRLRDGAGSTDQAVKIIDDCLDDLRRLFDSLDAEGETLWTVLASLLERMESRIRSLPVTLDWRIDAARRIKLPARVMLQAARIVQEALANALRHAQARSISLIVRVEKGRRLIVLADDGNGFDLNWTSTGRGLNNMRARAEEQGWQLTITSDTTGSCVTLDLG